MSEVQTGEPTDTKDETEDTKALDPVEAAVREIKAAYLNAKRSYRIDAKRLARIRSTANHYLGTRNFYNYTSNKTFKDPSAKRLIKTLNVNETPIIIGSTEWLSIKIHGQSFMMHQIRKMISMLTLIVRCGCPESRIEDSYLSTKMSIPRAPGLGLLLERPVFDTYSDRIKDDPERKEVAFVRYEKEMNEFKQREIYERIFREEEKESQFHALFSAVDNHKALDMLWLSSLGVAAAKKVVGGESVRGTGKDEEELVIGMGNESGDEGEHEGG